MMRPETLVSVILPVFNGADHIGDAIESVLAQTHTRLELLIVDDGSTDATPAVLALYAARDPRLRVFTQPNRGVASARNRAIAQARGLYLAPLDADDLWCPDKLARQLARILQLDQPALVYCGWVWIDRDGTVLDRSPHWTVEGEAFTRLIAVNFTGNASCPLFRTSAVLEAGGFNERLHKLNAGGCEDWELALRVAAAHPVGVVEQVLVGYRRRPGSMSTAAATMWRSHRLVMEAAKGLKPGLPLALFRGAGNQFALYLAGQAYWAGNRREAFRWATRAGLRLPLLVLPYALRLLLFPRAPAANPLRMEPGIPLDRSRIPEPLLPYDRIRHLPSPWRLARTLTRRLFAGTGHLARTLVHERRLRQLAKEARRATGSGQTRVLATACWHFPIYSQTFVYREVLALAAQGFTVAFAYSGRNPRTQLPDDCAAIWPLRRRLLLAASVADRDLAHFRRLRPSEFDTVLTVLTRASGLTRGELLAHRHVRHAFSFARMAEAWQADYLHTYFFYEAPLYAYVAATLLHLPRGISCYADHMLDDYELKLVALHLRTSDIVVATSARIRAELETIAAAPLPQAIVKPNGIDADCFTRLPTPRAPGDNRLRLTAVNRLHPKKGLLFLLEAASLLRDRGIAFELRILGAPDAGDHAYLEALERTIREHRLEPHVTLPGRQTSEEVRACLAATDVFAAAYIELPNGDKDGIPTALLEAMAAGCAIVTTSAGSIAEVITDGHEGLVVPQHDAPALAHAIERLALDPALRQRLAATALSRVRTHFDTHQCEALFHDRVRLVLAGEHHP